MPEEKVENQEQSKQEENLEQKEVVKEEKQSEKPKEKEEKLSSKQSEKKEESPEDKAHRLEEELKKRDKTIGDLQHRVDGLFAKTKELESSKTKEKTWDDLSVDELKEYRRKARANGDDELVDFINDKIADKSASKRIKDEADKREATYIRVNSWKETVAKYPELKDQGSEHYQETVEFLRKNPIYDNLLEIPDGHSQAAEIVSDRIKLRKLQNVDKEKSSLKDKLDKEKVKKDLGKAERKGGGEGEDENLSKLRKAAEESGNPYSKEWRTYLSALDKRDKQSKGG